MNRKIDTFKRDVLKLPFILFQEFAFKSKLKNHFNEVHIGARPFECPECGQVFIYINNFKLIFQSITLI